MGQSQSNPSREEGGGGKEPGARNRALAKQQLILRKDLSQKSQEAWQQGDRARAKEYSLASKEHQNAMEAYNALAAREIFISNNPTYLKTSTPSVASFFLSLFSSAPPPSSALAEIDLHGLYVAEALSLVEEHLVLCKKHMVERTMIITGKGLHSVDGVAKIKPQVEKMLQEDRDVNIVKGAGRAVNEGAFVVDFIKGGEAESGWGGWLWKSLFGR